MMKKAPLIITLIAIVLAILGIAIYNIANNDMFWDTSATTCISLFIAGGLSFYVVQRQTDRRKQKEIFAQLLDSIQDLVDDEKSFRLVDRSKDEILMQTRAIKNKVVFAKEYSDQFLIGEEMKFLEDKINEYQNIIDGHINDLITLRKLGADLKRPLSLMSQKIYEIKLKMYS